PTPDGVQHLRARPRGTPMPCGATSCSTSPSTSGSRRLHQALSEHGAAKLRGKKPPRALVQRRIKIRAERGILPQPHRWGEKRWKKWETNLLGTAPDAELAARFGRTVNAVRVMRGRRGVVQIRRLPSCSLPPGRTRTRVRTNAGAAALRDFTSS